MEFLTGSGKSIPIQVKRRKGTRHLRLRIRHCNEILLSAPWHSSDRAIVRFIQKQRDWLEAGLAEAPRVVTLSEWFDRHPLVSAGGEMVQMSIVVRESVPSSYCLDPQKDRLTVYLRGQSEWELYTITRRWAKDTLTDRTHYHAKRLGLEFQALTVRDQVSRWGSCSERGRLSLNWRLVLLPSELQEYVILHELAHLSEMNHGPRFRHLLDQYDPQRVVHEKHLSAIGSQIMGVGRSLTNRGPYSQGS